MSISEPSFTVGIEEEYLLVDKSSRDLVQDAPAALMKDCEEALGGQVSPEFLQCQIEVGTQCLWIGQGGACRSGASAQDDRRHCRRAHGSGAHCCLNTSVCGLDGAQRHTEKERYQVLARDLQGVVRRMLICGMHVHVCIEDPELRIDIFNQMSYFLPHVLALVYIIAVLAGPRHGAQFVPPDNLRQSAAHRLAT